MNLTNNSSINNDQVVGGGYIITKNRIFLENFHGRKESMRVYICVVRIRIDIHFHEAALYITLEETRQFVTCFFGLLFWINGMPNLV